VMSSLDWYISVGNHDHTDDFDELHQVGDILQLSDLMPSYFPHRLSLVT
jgi:hypothetical protein